MGSLVKVFFYAFLLIMGAGALFICVANFLSSLFGFRLFGNNDEDAKK